MVNEPALARLSRDEGTFRCIVTSAGVRDELLSREVQLLVRISPQTSHHDVAVLENVD
jgi:hypothetical protein